MRRQHTARPHSVSSYARRLLAFIAFRALEFGKDAAIREDHSVGTNGDSLCSPSSSPSPERIDESVLRESPLEMSILLLPETAMVLE